MKKIGLLFIAGLFTLGLAAQNVDAGTYHIGASSDMHFNMQMSSDDSVETVTNMGMVVEAGYFPIDNMVAGVQLHYTSMSQDGESTSNFGYGVYTRYYLMEGKLYTGASYSSVPNPKPLMSGWLADQLASYGVEEVLATIGIEAGYVHWFNDNVSLEPSLYYKMQSPKWEYEYEDSQGNTQTGTIDGEWIETMTGQKYDIAKLSEFGLKVGLSIYMN